MNFTKKTYKKLAETLKTAKLTKEVKIKHKMKKAIIILAMMLLIAIPVQAGLWEDVKDYVSELMEVPRVGRAFDTPGAEVGGVYRAQYPDGERVIVVTRIRNNEVRYFSFNKDTGAVLNNAQQTFVTPTYFQGALQQKKFEPITAQTKLTPEVNERIHEAIRVAFDDNQNLQVQVFSNLNPSPTGTTSQPDTSGQAAQNTGNRVVSGADRLSTLQQQQPEDMAAQVDVIVAEGAATIGGLEGWIVQGDKLLTTKLGEDATFTKGAITIGGKEYVAYKRRKVGATEFEQYVIVDKNGQLRLISTQSGGRVTTALIDSQGNVGDAEDISAQNVINFLPRATTSDTGQQPTQSRQQRISAATEADATDIAGQIDAFAGRVGQEKKPLNEKWLFQGDTLVTEELGGAEFTKGVIELNGKEYQTYLRETTNQQGGIVTQYVAVGNDGELKLFTKNPDGSTTVANIDSRGAVDITQTPVNARQIQDMLFAPPARPTPPSGARLPPATQFQVTFEAKKLLEPDKNKLEAVDKQIGAAIVHNGDIVNYPREYFKLTDDGRLEIKDIDKLNKAITDAKGEAKKQLEAAKKAAEDGAKDIPDSLVGTLVQGYKHGVTLAAKNGVVTFEHARKLPEGEIWDVGYEAIAPAKTTQFYKNTLNKDGSHTSTIDSLTNSNFVLGKDAEHPDDAFRAKVEAADKDPDKEYPDNYDPESRWRASTTTKKVDLGDGKTKEVVTEQRNLLITKDMIWDDARPAGDIIVQYSTKGELNEDSPELPSYWQGAGDFADMPKDATVPKQTIFHAPKDYNRKSEFVIVTGPDGEIKVGTPKWTEDAEGVPRMTETTNEKEIGSETALQLWLDKPENSGRLADGLANAQIARAYADRVIREKQVKGGALGIGNIVGFKAASRLLGDVFKAFADAKNIQHITNLAWGDRTAERRAELVQEYCIAAGIANCLVSEICGDYHEINADNVIAGRGPTGQLVSSGVLNAERSGVVELEGMSRQELLDFFGRNKTAINGIVYDFSDENFDPAVLSKLKVRLYHVEYAITNNAAGGETLYWNLEFRQTTPIEVQLPETLENVENYPSWARTLPSIETGEPLKAAKWFSSDQRLENALEAKDAESATAHEHKYQWSANNWDKVCLLFRPGLPLGSKIADEFCVPIVEYTGGATDASTMINAAAPAPNDPNAVEAMLI